MRPFCGALLHSLVKARDGQPAGGGIAADFVQSQKAMKAIKRGILKRLRPHRTGELLNLEGKAAVARNAMAGAPPGDKVERQRIPQETENPQVRAEPIGASVGERSFDDRAIFAARSRCGDVSAIDREMQNEQLERGAQALGGIVACGVMTGGDPREQARQYGEIARQNNCKHKTLGVDENSVKTAFLAPHVKPGPPKRGESAIVEKKPGDDVEPFIACRAGNSSKAREALSIGQNPFRRHVERCAL